MWQAKDISEIEKNFRTNRDYGITNEEAKKRLEYFGENVLKDKKKDKYKIRKSEDIYNYIKDEVRDLKQEHFYVLYLDNKKNIVEKKLLFVGTINGSVVHPREIFKYAYLNSASFIVCIHNHPSGDPTPSQEDVDLTNHLIDIGKLNNIPILDHIIIGDSKYYSFFEEG